MSAFDQPAHSRAASTGPIITRERIVALDSLRGFALLGILIANLSSFDGWYFMLPEQRAGLWSVGADGIVEFLQHVLITGKFYTIFSLLFGIGFAIQLSRLRARGGNFVGRYVRRLLILLGIGFLHMYLWYGDILMLYALCGLVLLFFRDSGDRTLIAWAVALILLPIPHYAVMWLGGIDVSMPLFELGARIATSDGIPGATSDAGMDALLPLLKEGGFRELFQVWLPAGLMRFGDFIFDSRMLKVFGIFLIGLWVGRRIEKGALLDNIDLLRRVVVVGLAVGLPVNIWLAVLLESGGTWPITGLGFAQTILYALGVVPLGLAYAAGFALLLRRSSWRRPLGALAPVGRMALTNYLGQTVVGVSLFYGVGLGLMGTMGPLHWTILALVIFATQLMLSMLWLRYFRFGPMEWLWRSLTYGETQRFRVTP